MRFLGKTLAALFLAALFALSGAQEYVTWSAKLDPGVAPANGLAKVVLTAKIAAGFHTYSIHPVEGGPFPTTITLPENPVAEKAGDPGEDAPKIEMDPNFGKEIGRFDGSATFTLPVRIKAGVRGKKTFKVSVRFMSCNDQFCNPPKTVELPVPVEVSGSVAPTAGSTTTPGANGPVDAASAQIKQALDSGFWPLILLALGFGFLSLLTPCVFPMIPITVSFFSKQKGEDDKIKLAGPVAYCLGIIGTFTLLGVAIGATGLNRVATNPWVNIGLAALFIVLAASLFGVFEIRLPNWLINKASSKSRGGGLVGPLLMGLTFTLTSFTCTVPFVGSLLVASAQKGLMYSIIGMLAYSTAFALPFFLLALFPSFLTKLPRSGAWLVTVKAFMGFLELMAALKFLSNVDLAFRLGWLTRPVFLAIWVTTAAVGGLYMLGWLRLPSEGEPKVGWIRRGFGVATIGLAVFCLMGLTGRPLGQLSAFLPPDPYPGQTATHKGVLTWETTYTAALEKAKATNRNVFIDFTGIYCTNCRDIEENVFTRPEVEKTLGKFVLARLYTDDGSPENNANQELQKRLANGVVTLPLYVVVAPDGTVLKIHQQQPPIEDADQFLSAIKPFSASVVARR